MYIVENFPSHFLLRFLLRRPNQCALMCDMMARIDMYGYFFLFFLRSIYLYLFF